MTDNEIIIKLEKLLRMGDSPIGKGFGVIMDKGLLQEVVDLINEQRVDIEGLETLRKTYENHLLVIPEIRKEMKKEIKAESIKEFVKRVENKLSTNGEITWDGYHSVMGDIELMRDTMIEE